MIRANKYQATKTNCVFLSFFLKLMSAWFWFSNLTMQNDFKANELVLVCKTQARVFNDM